MIACWKKQNKSEAYYMRARHKNCDTFYSAQNYFRLPRQAIREKSNFTVVFPQDQNTFINITIAVMWMLMNLNLYVIESGKKMVKHF